MSYLEVEPGPRQKEPTFDCGHQHRILQMNVS